MIELVDHTGELELRLSGPTQADLYEEALRALAAETSDRGGADPLVRRPLAISASGPDTLLVDLLNEAIFLMETESFVPTGLEVAELSATELSGELSGHLDPDLRPLAKAATYHGLSVRGGPGGWEARLVLDV